MAVLDEETIQRIKSQLRHHAKGMMISDLSRAMKINRNIMSKYLDILLMSGEVEMEMRGNAKVYTLSRRVPLSTMFDSSSDYIILLDGKGRILWLNTALLTLLGKPPEEFAGRHLAEAGDPFFQCLPFREKPDSGETVSEISCPLHDKVRFFRVKQTPAVLANGSMGSILNCEDITAESIFKQMVELSEARFRAIVEDQTEFIVRFHPGGTLTFANGSYARMTGMDPERLAGTSFFLRMPEDDVLVFRKRVGELDSRNSVVSIECRVLQDNGTVHRQQWTVRALFDNNGNITEYQGVGRDITGQAEAQERLRRHAADMEFISRKAREFLELPSEAGIYSAIADGLAELLPDAAISVNSLYADASDPQAYTMTIQAVTGMDARDVFKKYTGIDVVGFSYRVKDQAAIDYVMQEGLHKAYGDLYSCSFGNIPYHTCKEIEKALDLGQTYIHALASEGRILGEVSIFTRKGSTILNRNLIEAYLHQASLVLAWRMAVGDLRKSEALSRTIIEDQTEYVTRFRPDGTLTFMNSSYARTMRKDPAELAGTPHMLFLTGDELPGIRNQIAALAPGKEVTVVECSKPCGRRRNCRQQWTVRAFFDTAGNVTEYQGVGRDITEQAESEESLRRHAADMEFISRKAREFLELPPEADIYVAMAEGLSELVADAAICVSSCDPLSMVFTIRNVCGIGARETFRKMTGNDIIGLSFSPKDPSAIEFIRIPTLHKAYGHLYNALFGQVPFLLCKQLEETLDLDEIFILGLFSQDQLLGCASILLKKGHKIPNPDLVEAFIRQSSLVLAWRRADESLRQSEARFRAIVEDQTEFVTRFMPDGTLTYVNNSYARFIDKRPDELAGTMHLPYIISDVIPALENRLPSADPNNLVTTAEFNVLSPSGCVRWLQWTVRALPDSAGNLIGYQGIGRDITEIHAAEESTREHIASMEFLSRKAREFMEIATSTEIFSAILRGLDELVPDATITISSFEPHIKSIIVKGALPSRILPFFRDLTGEDLIEKAMVVSDPDAIERMKSNRIHRIPGDLYYVMFGVVPMAVARRIEDYCCMGGEKYAIGLVAQNRLLGTVLIVPKIGAALTNRNLIETFIRQASVALAQRLDAEALRQSEGRFRAITEDQTEFVTRFLPDGTLTFVNAALCRAVDKKLEDLLGRSFFSMIPADAQTELQAALGSLSPDNPKTTIRHRVSGPGGNTCWFEWTNRAVFDDSGRVVEYDGVGRDITVLHEASSRIRKHPADIQFLSQHARGLIGMQEPQRVMAFTAKRIQSVLPGSIIGVCSYVPVSGELIFRHIEGSPEAVSTMRRVLQKDLPGMAFPYRADPDMITHLGSTHLVPGSGHLGSFFNFTSPEACSRIAECLNLGRSYLMALPSSDGTMDAVFIQLEAGSELQNPELIEAAINQAGLALARVQGKRE